jgi:hypothetical protein
MPRLVATRVEVTRTALAKLTSALARGDKVERRGREVAPVRVGEGERGLESMAAEREGPVAALGMPAEPAMRTMRVPAGRRVPVLRVGPRAKTRAMPEVQAARGRQIPAVKEVRAALPVRRAEAAVIPVLTRLGHPSTSLRRPTTHPMDASSTRAVAAVC